MGASRIELCENIAEGGITPSEELTLKALEVSTIPINVMIRPRGGNFVYTREEIQVMIAQIHACKAHGLAGKAIHKQDKVSSSINGIVLGALTPDNEVDMPTMKHLIEAIHANATASIDITFHRAFDRVANPQKALEEIIELGCTHLLTSGNMSNAYEGRFNIANLVKQAAGRITIIAGKGINRNNLLQIAKDSNAPQFHGTNLF